MNYPKIRGIEKEFMLDEEFERRFKKPKAAAE